VASWRGFILRIGSFKGSRSKLLSCLQGQQLA
jgi:hypothetical protein